MQTLKLIKKENYAIVQLNRGKVNAINQQMVHEIRETFKTLQNDDAVRGIILTGIPHFFSAGLDVIELFQYDKNQIREFFHDFGAMYNELAHFPKALICAITGHCPAGGTVLAIQADYRIMAEGPKYTIGLNEVAVNIQISQNLIETYSFWLGKRQAHRFILEGKLLRVDEALKSGLVDEVCPLEEVLHRAEVKMQQYLHADPEIFVNTKRKLRKSWLEKLSDKPEQDLEMAIATWWRPEIRERMAGFINRLQKK